jgi:hypothetical protein
VYSLPPLLLFRYDNQVSVFAAQSFVAAFLTIAVFLTPSSSGAQHATLQKYLSRASLVIQFFSTPLIKLKLE